MTCCEYIPNNDIPQCRAVPQVFSGSSPFSSRCISPDLSLRSMAALPPMLVLIPSPHTCQPRGDLKLTPVRHLIIIARSSSDYTGRLGS